MGIAPLRNECEGPHSRQEWSEKPALKVQPHTKWSLVKNGGGGDIGSADALKKSYEKAKKLHSEDDAYKIVEHYWDEAAFDAVMNVLLHAIMRDEPLIVVYPNPKFQTVDETATKGRFVTNALPGMLAHYLAAKLGADIDTELVQIARPGRTSLDRIDRLLYQPKFSGSVDPNAVYVLVDDAYTLGGTLVTLRSHIVENGGTVGAVCVLCNGTGKAVSFPAEDKQLSEVVLKFGADIRSYWKEQVGHEIEKLTFNEALFLSEWAEDRKRDGHRPPLLHALRTRFDSARANAK